MSVLMGYIGSRSKAGSLSSGEAAPVKYLPSDIVQKNPDQGAGASMRAGPFLLEEGVWCTY